MEINHGLDIVFGEEKQGYGRKKQRAKDFQEIEIERLFARKSGVLNDIQFKRQSIGLSIVKLVLKSICEAIRLLEFNEYGFQ